MNIDFAIKASLEIEGKKTSGGKVKERGVVVAELWLYSLLHSPEGNNLFPTEMDAICGSAKLLTNRVTIQKGKKIKLKKLNKN